ncbi:MAG: redoxin domain-containing protein [Phycisphaerales bacterium JB060]
MFTGHRLVATSGLAMAIAAGPAWSQAEERAPADPGTERAQPAAEQRPAEQILAEYRSVEMPTFDASRRGNEGYQAEFREARDGALDRRSELIGELFRSHADHEALAELMPLRWRIMMSRGEAERVFQETSSIADDAADPELRIEALHARTLAVARLTEHDTERVADAAARFYEAAPRDARNASLRMMTTHARRETEALKRTYRSIAEEYPDTREGTQAAAKVYQLDQIGEPFELSFEEATTGEPIDMSALRGRVVVVGFWATWCGPCIAEMPHMKKLYAAYKDKGVEFIGVSLDEPRNEEDPSKDGLVKLRNWVEANGVTWPQYYQGNGWNSEFSSGWKVRSIPAIFLVDQQGRLVTPNARGKLDEMIPELLGIDPVELDESEQGG